MLHEDLRTFMISQQNWSL